MGIRKKIKKALFEKLLPRSIQYVPEPSVNQMYISGTTISRKIKILYVENGDGPHGNNVVILAHPYISHAKLFFHHSGHVQFYRNSGFSVVMFDFNGFGESPFSDFNFEKDIEAVVHWTETHLNSKNIVLHGISFGAAQIIKYGVIVKSDRIFCIIENCLDKGIHYFLKRNKFFYVFLRLLNIAMPGLRRKDDLTYGISLSSAFRAAGFIYNRDDLLTTPDMGEKLMKNCQVPFSNIVLPGKHLEGILQAPDYQAYLNEFFNRYIGVTRDRI